MRAVKLTGALPDPQEVTGHVIRVTGARVDPGKRALVIHGECLVGGVELNPLEFVRVRATGMHERESAINVTGHEFITLTRHRVTNKVLVPCVDLSQIRESAHGECTNKIKCRARSVVGTKQSFWIGSAGTSFEFKCINGISEIGGHFDSVANFNCLTSGLEVLAG